MRVKMFRHFVTSDLELEMNKWLEENPSIKVVKMIQSSSTSKFGDIYTLLTILYKPIYSKQDTGPR